MDIIVIGGGPAGIMAAITAAEGGAKVKLWERNERLGRKLAITGKGRCNITNNTEIDDLIKHIPGNGRFLFSAFSHFSAQDTMSFFERLGLPLKTERGRRVFPVSDKAADVINILTKHLHSIGVDIEYNKRARNLIIEDGVVAGVVDQNGKKSFADAVIIATGGVTYPATGSTGDGYVLAVQAGHTLIPPAPSLVPLETVEEWPKNLSGLTLKNVELSVYAGNKLIGKEFGEMLFTHFGISGPIVLSLSRIIIEAGIKDIVLALDLKPALNAEQLDDRLRRDLEKFSRRHFINSLSELLPMSMIPVIAGLCGIDQHKPCNQINKEERLALGSLLKAVPIKVSAVRPVQEAIVTMGGVCIKEVSPKTMESKLCKKLFFVGEILDIDGFTGGFNLQVAWSTGYLAGFSAVQSF